MKNKITNYFKTIFFGLGVFLNTLIAGSPQVSLWNRIEYFTEDLILKFKR